MNAFRSAAFFAAAALCATSAFAQEKHTLSFKVPTSAAKYLQQHSIAVGDQPGHEVRIFDLVRDLGNDGPVIAGLRIKHIRSVGASDYTNLSGPATSYATFTMENGDKFFVRTSIVSHAVEFGNTRKGATNLTSGPIYGGTGKLAGLRGTLRNASQFDPKSGINESRFDIEYWVEGLAH